MTNKEKVLQRERERGRLAALSVQELSANMTGTELNAEDDKIPLFSESIKVKNMLERPIGFVCRSEAGRVVKLLQPYDSTIFTAEPEELPAQFGFVWSTDPAKAQPFIALSTSPYNIGECCLNAKGEPKRSNLNGNIWSPDETPQFWDDI